MKIEKEVNTILEINELIHSLEEKKAEIHAGERERYSKRLHDLLKEIDLAGYRATATDYYDGHEIELTDNFTIIEIS